jgi:hypothetical protein
MGKPVVGLVPLERDPRRPSLSFIPSSDPTLAPHPTALIRSPLSCPPRPHSSSSASSSPLPLSIHSLPPILGILFNWSPSIRPGSSERYPNGEKARDQGRLVSPILVFFSRNSFRWHACSIIQSMSSLRKIISLILHRFPFPGLVLVLVCVHVRFVS